MPSLPDADRLGLRRSRAGSDRVGGSRSSVYVRREPRASGAVRHYARGVGSLGVVEPLEQVDGGPGVVADPSIVDALDRQRGEREVPLPADPASRHQLGRARGRAGAGARSCGRARGTRRRARPWCSGDSFSTSSIRRRVGEASALKTRSSRPLACTPATCCKNTTCQRGITDSTRCTFTVSGRIARPVAEVYEAVADPTQLSRYFTTGGARGRLEAGGDGHLGLPRLPGRLPGHGRRGRPAAPDRHRVGGRGHTGDRGTTTTTFEFEPIDDGARTLVTITESSWQVYPRRREARVRQLRGLDRHARRDEGLARARDQPARRLLRVAPCPPASVACARRHPLEEPSAPVVRGPLGREPFRMHEVGLRYIASWARVISRHDPRCRCVDAGPGTGGGWV